MIAFQSVLWYVWTCKEEGALYCPRMVCWGVDGPHRRLSGARMASI